MLRNPRRPCVTADLLLKGRNRGISVAQRRTSTGPVFVALRYRVSQTDPSVATGAEVSRTVNRRPNVAMQRAVERHLLCEEDRHQVIGWINPEQRRCGAVPEELAHRSPVLCGLLW